MAEFKRVEDVKGGAFDSRLPAPPLASYSNSWVSVSIAGGIEQSKHLADDSYSLQVRVVCVLPVVRKSPASSSKAAGVGRLAQTT